MEDEKQLQLIVYLYTNEYYISGNIKTTDRTEIDEGVYFALNERVLQRPTLKNDWSVITTDARDIE